MQSAAGPAVNRWGATLPESLPAGPTSGPIDPGYCEDATSDPGRSLELTRLGPARAGSENARAAALAASDGGQPRRQPAARPPAGARARPGPPRACRRALRARAAAQRRGRARTVLARRSGRAGAAARAAEDLAAGRRV